MSFPEQPFGFVAGRWVRSIGDTPGGEDRAPDYIPVKAAKVVFTPQATHRVATDSYGWAGIIKDRVSAGLGERGQLVDAEGHDDLALAVGVYSVTYEFDSGWSWPSHYIEVKSEHTADSPLWLPPIAPPPKGPMIENRVVTIPTGGEDGQVLVWDGGGFSWMDVPEGPRGLPGEVTTADLTTVLAGKVTGTGMTLRHDTSVGERVFLDHPGGSIMLYGDTGWRSIPATSVQIPGLTEIFIRRTTHHLHVAIHANYSPTPGEAETIATLPTGFRAAGGPTLGRVPFDLLNGYAPDASRPDHTVYIDQRGEVRLRMAGTARFQASLTVWAEPDWPTSQHGTPL